MKQILRKKMLEKLNKLPIENKETISNQIYEQLFNSTYWKESVVLGITLSNEIEWDTYKIIKRAWTENKKVTVPVTDELTHTMKFYLINSLEDLNSGTYGIDEPINQSSERYFNKSAIDLMIVPGVVYDKAGYRVGFGKGYYDRYLKDFNNITISLLAEFQIIKQIPTNQYDISVDYLITEKRILKTN